MKKVMSSILTATLSLASLEGHASNEVTSLRAGKNEIQFNSMGVQLAANLYLPKEFSAENQYPTVIYSGPMTQIKEQTGAVYGKKLAEKGFVVLTYDPVGFGQSEGNIRNYENPYFKMENIRDGVSHLGTLPFVDKSRLFGLGICASGTYMALVATTDKRLKAITTVSGMMNNNKFFFDSLKREQVVNILSNANAARQRTYETGKIEYVDAMGLESVDPDKTDKDSVFYGARDFYLTERGGVKTHKGYDHHGPSFQGEQGALFSAMPFAPFLYTPYLGIYGEKAMQDTGPLTVDFYKAASEPKELYEVKGANHVSLYDNEKHVTQAVERMTEFFFNQEKEK